MTKAYELCVLFSGNETPANIEKAAKQVETLLTDAGAAVKANHNLGRKKLAYPIKGNQSGEYRLWFFTVDSGLILPLKEKLRLSNFIVRPLLLSLSPDAFAKQLAKIKEARNNKNREAVSAEKEPTPREPIGVSAPVPEMTMEALPEIESIEPTTRPSKEKASLDELDKKLDEILGSDTL